MDSKGVHFNLKRRYVKLPGDEHLDALLEGFSLIPRRRWNNRSLATTARYRAVYNRVLKSGRGATIRSTVHHVDTLWKSMKPRKKNSSKPMPAKEEDSPSTTSPPTEQFSPLEDILETSTLVIEVPAKVDTSALRKPAAICLNPLIHTGMSMSQRRLASNLPFLKRQLSFGTFTDIRSSKGTEPPSFSFLFPIPGCSTPVTPLDQIIHTPLHPPELHRNNSVEITLRLMNEMKLSSPANPTPNVSPLYGKSSTPRCPISAATRNGHRRRSSVTPPDLVPSRAPRRLSYSQTFGGSILPNSSKRVPPSPVDKLRGCADFNSDLLASPLSIRSPSSVLSFQSTGPMYVNDSGSILLPSPRVLKV